MLKRSLILPPASEGWGKVIFSVFVSVHTSMGRGGTPSTDGGGYPLPRSRWGGGLPQPVLDRGGTPSQVQVGVPPPWEGGTPAWTWEGVPPLSVDGVPPNPGLDGFLPPPPLGRGYPLPGPGKGYPPCQWMGYPPIQDWMGSSPPPPPPTVRRQSSIASTCYGADGMPLAFMQEDFLVYQHSRSRI